MKCPHCDYIIDKPNRKTCPCCGAPITAEGSTQIDEVYPPEPHYEPGHTDPPRPEPLHPEEPQQLCPRCDTPLPEGFNFCPKCGYNVREPEANTFSDEIPTARISSDFRTQPEPEHYHPEPEHYEPEPQHYESEPEHYEPEPEPQVEEPEPVYNDDNDEDNPVMGGYYPYPGEEPTADTGVDVPKSPATGSSSSWLVIVIASIVSLLLGVLLYLVFN